MRRVDATPPDPPLDPALAELAEPLEGPVEVVRRRFEARYAIAADTYGALAGPDELDEAWEGFSSGAWAAVFAEPGPEVAVRASRLAAAIARLVDEPRPEDWRWRNRLRARVDQLATLLLPVDPAVLDPDADPPWRATWVDDVRARFAEALADADADAADDEDLLTGGSDR